MFGDLPSDYCGHEAWRLKLVGQRVVCQCGFASGFQSKLLVTYLQRQDERIARLEKALANFTQ